MKEPDPRLTNGLFKAITIFGERFNRRIFFAAVLLGLVTLLSLSFTGLWYFLFLPAALIYYSYWNQRYWDKYYDALYKEEKCTKIPM